MVYPPPIPPIPPVISIRSASIKAWQRYAAIAGVAVASLTILRFVIPICFDLLMADRDREIQKQAIELAALRESLKETLGATRDRLQQIETNTNDMRETLTAIRTEMRVRFNSRYVALDSKVSNAEVKRSAVMSTASGNVVEAPTNSRSERIDNLVQQTDINLRLTQMSAPSGPPLPGIVIKN